MNDASQMEKAYATGGTSTPWNGLTSFIAKNDNKLDLNVYLDSADGKSPESILELWGHEGLVHGNAFSKYLGKLKELGFEAFQVYQQQGNDIGKSDHISLRDQDFNHPGYKKYDSMKRDLIKRDSRYKKLLMQHTKIIK